MVRAFALAGGRQQEPEYFENLGVGDNFALVDSIGAERFQLTQQQCDGAEVDWAEISQQPEREALERHRRRFHDCPTAELARRALVSLLGSSEVVAPTVAASSKQVDDCDRLAASESDPSRPPEVPGVPLDKIDFDAATAACEKSIDRNSRIVRYLFNLGRAKFAAANALRLDDPARKPLIVKARADYNDAANRGYVAALFSLATLSAYSDASDEEQDHANTLLLKAAIQEFPPAMYELGQRLSKGSFGLQRDLARGLSLVCQGGGKRIGSGDGGDRRCALPWARRRAKSAPRGRVGATRSGIGVRRGEAQSRTVLFQRLQTLQFRGRTRLQQRPFRRNPGAALVGARGRRRQSGRAVLHGADDGARVRPAEPAAGDCGALLPPRCAWRQRRSGDRIGPQASRGSHAGQTGERLERSHRPAQPRAEPRLGPGGQHAGGNLPQRRTRSAQGSGAGDEIRLSRD